MAFVQRSQGDCALSGAACCNPDLSRAILSVALQKDCCESQNTV